MTLPAGIKKCILDYLYMKLPFKRILRLCKCNLYIKKKVMDCTNISTNDRFIEILLYFQKHNIKSKRIINIIYLLKFLNGYDHLVRRIFGWQNTSEEILHNTKMVSIYYKDIENLNSCYCIDKPGFFVADIIDKRIKVEYFDEFKKLGVNFAKKLLFRGKLINIFNKEFLEYLELNENYVNQLFEYAKKEGIKIE